MKKTTTAALATIALLTLTGCSSNHLTLDSKPTSEMVHRQIVACSDTMHATNAANGQPDNDHGVTSYCQSTFTALAKNHPRQFMHTYIETFGDAEQ